MIVHLSTIWILEESGIRIPTVLSYQVHPSCPHETHRPVLLLVFVVVLVGLDLLMHVVERPLAQSFGNLQVQQEQFQGLYMVIWFWCKVVKLTGKCIIFKLKGKLKWYQKNVFFCVSKIQWGLEYRAFKFRTNSKSVCCNVLIWESLVLEWSGPKL